MTRDAFIPVASMRNLLPGEVFFHDTYFIIDWRQLVAWVAVGLAIAGVIAWFVSVKRR